MGAVNLLKTLGIIGGLGPESTIEYYRFVLDGYRARVTDGSAPHLIIDSLDVNRGIAMLDANDLLSLTSYLSASVERLARAGAEIALIAANTPHLVFDEVARQAPIPMLSIVQATRQSELLSLGVSTRGALALNNAAKALALVRGREYCLPDDIKELAAIVLSHRVMLSRAQGMRMQSFEQAERIILDIVDTIPVPV